jgi:hypothetical protein
MGCTNVIRGIDSICQTPRALDAGESAAISGSFLHLSIFPIGRRSAVRPSASTEPLGATFCSTRVKREYVMNDESTAWESYEEVATFLLNQFAHEFGLQKFEGKQTIFGKRSGTKWEIDAKGVSENNEIFFIVECRRYTKSRQNQEKLGGLAYRITDTGAKGGILVSPLGLQEGAAKVAQAENIHTVILDENSTRLDFMIKFLDKVRYGKHNEGKITPTGNLSAKVIRADGTTEEYHNL